MMFASGSGHAAKQISEVGSLDSEQVTSAVNIAAEVSSGRPARAGKTRHPAGERSANTVRDRMPTCLLPDLQPQEGDGVCALFARTVDVDELLQRLHQLLLR